MNSTVPLLRPREVSMLLTLLAFGLLLRLIQISQPFIDGWSWREADVAMIAENFYRHGFHLFYPQINWAGSSPGYVGTEFPLVPFVAALLYLFFGVQDWIGRALSIFFFAASVPFFHLLVRKISRARSALFAVGIYTLAPLSIFASRSFMPDMASLSFSIAALYLFAEWLEREADIRLFTAMTLATSLAILMKLPAIIIGLPMLYMAWEKYGPRFVRRRELWIFAALSLFLPVAWYAHAYRMSLSHFPYHFFGSGGIKIEPLDWYIGILYQTVTSGLTPIVFAAMLAGIFLPPRARLGRLFHWWLAAMLLFVVVAGPGNRHPWYQLPFVPIAAAFAGLACDVASRSCVVLTGSKLVPLLAGIVLWGGLVYLSYVAIKPLYEHQRPPLWWVGQELNRITPTDARVIVADDGDPRAIYYSGRKGWHFLQDGLFKGYPADSQRAITLLEQWRGEGAGYLAFPQDGFWWFAHYPGLQEYLDSRYQRLSETDEYIIFDVTSGRAQLPGRH